MTHLRRLALTAVQVPAVLSIMAGLALVAAGRWVLHLEGGRR